MNSNKFVIKPHKSWGGIGFRELWDYRDLFYFFAWRDIKVRYKQTAIGILWAILQPFLIMIIFSIFFGKIAGLSSGEIPYPIFTYTGLLFWQYFANSLNSASDSLVVNQQMVQKIYFPRIILPLSATIVYFIDFIFASIIFVGLMFYYHFIPTFLGIILIIPSLIIVFLSFSGLGLFFSSINVKYRDIRYALPFFIQSLIFVTPVIYPTSILGDNQWYLYLNPMSGVIETMRASLLGTGSINWTFFGISALSSLIFFLIGFLYFRKTERYFADLI